MRIHITGMSPRMVSQRAREQMTFARTLEWALREMGHEVRRGSDDPWDAELIIAGVTSMLSPGASYALIGLEHIGRAIEQEVPLLLFADDPDLAKTRSAAQSTLRSSARLYSDYLKSKRIAASRYPSTQQQKHITTAIQTLAGETWPTVLLPMHPWASTTIAAKRLGITSEVVPLDVSSTVELFPLSSAGRVKADLWLTDAHYSSSLLDQDRVTWPVIPINSATIAYPPLVYSVAKGVHQSMNDRLLGWWTPTPLYVAQARTVFLCDAVEGQLISPDGPYYLTPDDVEQLLADVHADLAEAQAQHLKEITWNQETLSSRLTDLTGPVSSSERLVTSTPR